MTARYFVSTPVQGSQARIEGAEAHHLLHVMRGKPGDQVTIFDGSGFEFLAQIARTTRRDVEFTVVEKSSVSRESARRVTLAVALPKGDRQSWLVEKAVELGVAALVPLTTERSQVQITPSLLERLRRGVIEASKQCERNVLMEIAPPITWSDFAATETGSQKLMPVPGASELLRADQLPSESEPVIVAIGPEGDWSPAEVGLAQAHGWRPVSLGPRILRVETAAIFAAGLLIGTAPSANRRRPDGI